MLNVVFSHAKRIFLRVLRFSSLTKNQQVCKDLGKIVYVGAVSARENSPNLARHLQLCQAKKIFLKVNKSKKNKEYNFIG